MGGRGHRTGPQSPQPQEAGATAGQRGQLGQQDRTAPPRKSQGELADLVWSLVRRFPEIYQEFRERIALQEGDVGRLVAEARREIRQVTSETAWQNDWTGEGHIPDYSKIQHRFERLLELGHADAVVSLGREFIAQGLRQIGEAHDEGDTATAFAECLPVVFQAVTRSSLSGPERLLFAIDAELADDYDALGDSTEALFDAPAQPQDWSVVADTLAQRLKTSSAQEERGAADSFSRNYARDRVTNWIATALENAGRDQELRTLYESEAQATGSYERLVRFLLEQKHFEDAERWARKGIAATSAKLPGIATSLAASLCELAQKRQQWDVVAAHAAFRFFSDHPSPSTFDELVKAARKAGVEEPVRAAALLPRNGGPTVPGDCPAPRGRDGQGQEHPNPGPGTRRRDPVQDQARGDLPGTDAGSPGSSEDRAPVAAAFPRLPPPVPGSAGAVQPGAAPASGDPAGDGADRQASGRSAPLVRQDAVRSPRSRLLSRPVRIRLQRPRRGGGVRRIPGTRLAIYTAALNAQLPHAQQSSYESATAYLRKLRPLYEALNRASEWTALVASIREKYRNRPRFMDLLDGLEGRSIVQSARTRRK